MKPSTLVSLRWIVEIVLALLVGEATAACAENIDRNDSVPPKIVATKGSAASAGSEATTPNAPVILYLIDPTGNVFRLIYVGPRGWRFASGWQSPDRLAVAGSHLAARIAEVAATTDPTIAHADPATVFIDGPTGFVFGWLADEGWTYLGHFTDIHPDRRELEHKQ